jgi:predicted glycosyltransferase
MHMINSFYDLVLIYFQKNFMKHTYNKIMSYVCDIKHI